MYHFSSAECKYLFILPFPLLRLCNMYIGKKRFNHFNSINICFRGFIQCQVLPN